MDVGTTEQWLGTGISPGRMRTLVRTGQLVRCRRGTYATAEIVAAADGDPVRRHALDLLAAIAGRPGAVASHQSAAVLHGLPLLTPPPAGTVIVSRPPGSFRGLSSADTRYYSAELPSGHVASRLGVPVTTAARTVVDLARTLPFIDGVVAADAAVHAMKANKAELTRIADACTRWPGVGRARQVIEFSSGLAESPLESCARVTFAAYGLPTPRLQAEVGIDFRVDFLWPEYKTVAETDGLAKYNNGKDATRELRRDRLLRDWGFKVVHITWAELFKNSEHVVGRIRRAFKAATAY